MVCYSLILLFCLKFGGGVIISRLLSIDLEHFQFYQGRRSLG